MAVVRCPHCQKPNPDFLELCQYCDQSLREDAGPAEPPPAAANPAASSWDALETPTSGDEAQPEGDLPGWVSALAEDDAAAPSEGAPTLPDWFSSLSTEDAPVASPAPKAFEADDPDATSGQSTPDWFADPEAADAPVDELQPALPDWLSALRTDPTTEYDAPEPAASALPEWLQEAGPEAPAEAAAEAQPAWLQDLAEPDPAEVAPTEVAPTEAATPEPAWLASLAPLGAAAALSDADDDPVKPPPQPGPADDGEALPPAPAWALEDEEPPRAPIGEDDLSQAELPAWLAAMRPTEIQGAPHSGEQPEPAEGDSYEEVVGVLAGMRGVLRAEPSVVLPGKAANQIHTLTATESQNKAAQVLAALARAEVGQAAPATRRPFSLPLLRWLVAALMLLAAMVPFWAPELFGEPAPLVVGSETALAAQAIEDLGRDGTPRRPVLMVIDYEPGQAAELSPVAEVFARHILRLGLPVVAVGTAPGSAGVAEQVLTRSAQDMSNVSGFDYEPYTHLVNLGYLPGGGVGVVEFAVDPRRVFLSDFSGHGDALWDQPALAGVESLSDFGALVIVSGSPEGARAWIEQTAFINADHPIVIAASAGAGPLLRPYLASQGGPVDGMVTGLRAAAQYERHAGLVGDATERWSATGGILLMAAIVILIGNVLAGLSRLRLRR